MGRSRFLCPDVTLYDVHSAIIFSLYIIWYVILSFSPILFLYVFLFVILKFFLNLYHSIIITVCPSLCYLFLSRHFSLSRSLYSFFFSYYLFVILCFLFMSIVRYTSFIFLCIFLIPFIFVLASKRNNYTDSEMNTLIVFHFVPLITRDQQWCACSAYPVFSVARSANSASSCYAIAICSEPII